MYKYLALSEQLLVSLARPYYLDKKWKHVLLVLRQAQDIKQKPLSDTELAAIYLHDSLKKRVGQNNHLKYSAILAKKLLKNKYNKDQINTIYKAIRLHSPDYRQSFKNFQHSSPLAELLALADDSNNLRRDPDLMAMYSVKYNKAFPELYDTVDKGYDRHVSYFGPLHAHPNLKYYADRWKQYAKLGIKNIDHYPRLKYKILWKLINKDTDIPPIDTLTKEL